MSMLICGSVGKGESEWFDVKGETVESNNSFVSWSDIYSKS